jgi:hypothetical protein
MRIRGPTLVACALALVAPAAAQPLFAQDGFLFSRPSVQFTVRAGPVLHTARSDLFDFITSELTLERSDFRAPALAGEFAVAVHPRLDLSLGVGWSSTERSSESAHWYGTDDLPIVQQTTLRVTPVSLSARFYPWTRGTTVSNLAWLPVRTTPYVGAGADMTWYRFGMEGEFVHEDLSITNQNYQSSGRATTLHARVGLDHWFSPRVGLNLEGRYTHGSASPTDDFRTYDSLDLGGVQAGIGLSVRW